MPYFIILLFFSGTLFGAYVQDVQLSRELKEDGTYIMKLVAFVRDSRDYQLTVIRRINSDGSMAFFGGRTILSDDRTKRLSPHQAQDTFLAYLDMSLH